jgi:hypothetical protein
MEPHEMEPLEKIEHFCREFKQEHIEVFLRIFEKMNLLESMKTEPRRQLNSAIHHLSAFVEDSKMGFPHGGKASGQTETVGYLVFLLDNLLTQTNAVIQQIYIWLIIHRNDSYTFKKGYNQQSIQLIQAYKVGLRHWDTLVEPILTMVAKPVNTFNYHVKANSRVVNTFNRPIKQTNLPHANPYVDDPNNPLKNNNQPVAVYPRPSLSPRRTYRRKTQAGNNRTMNPNRKKIKPPPKRRVKGIRI